jgi:hypothetical protein
MITQISTRKLFLERKALPTNFLSQRKFDQRNVYFLVKVFACKKALAQVLFLKESVLREKTEKFLKVRLACKRQAPEEGRRKR